jgi:hypothetical protein
LSTLGLVTYTTLKQAVQQTSCDHGMSDQCSNLLDALLLCPVPLPCIQVSEIF